MEKRKHIAFITIFIIIDILVIGAIFWSRAKPLPTDAKITDAYFQTGYRLYLIDENGDLYVKGAKTSESIMGNSKNIWGSRPGKKFENTAFLNRNSLVTTKGDLYCWDLYPYNFEGIKKEYKKSPYKIMTNIKKSYIEVNNAKTDVLLAVIDKQDNLKIRGGVHNVDVGLDKLPSFYSEVENMVAFSPSPEDVDQYFITKDKKLYSFNFRSNEAPQLIADDVIDAAFYSDNYLCYLTSENILYARIYDKSVQLFNEVETFASGDSTILIVNMSNEIEKHIIKDMAGNTEKTADIIPKTKVSKLFTNKSNDAYLGVDQKLYCYGENYIHNPGGFIFTPTWHMFDDERSQIGRDEEPAVFPNVK